MNESWKDVEGYEGLYQVSNCGRVKSLERMRLVKSGCFGKVKEKILKHGKNKSGYLQVLLWKDGKQKSHRVQRLVANAFIPNPENKPEVNHKDENKENNCVWNLEWCDRKYNCNYGARNEKMLKSRNGKNALKKVLCVETNKVYPSAHEAERQTGIFNQSIIKCCKGKYKSTNGYHWQYA